MNRILVVLLTSFVLTFPLMAQDIKAESKTNILARPTLDSRVVDVLQAGDSAELLSKRTRNGYYHVRVKEHREGWVKKATVTITDGPAHNLATFAAHVSTEDRAHRIARDASDAETHFCGHIANSEACHDSFAEGCTLSQKPNTYDAYLNYFKNLTPSPDSAASQAVHTPSNLFGRLSEIRSFHD